MSLRCGSEPGCRSLNFSESTTAAAISSCTWKMSFTSRSKVCDQRCTPSAVRISWAVTRTVPPARRTLPSSTCATPKVEAISDSGASLPLK